MVMMGEWRSSGDFWVYDGGGGLCGFGGMI